MKNIYYKHQKITYNDQNVLGIIHNIIFSLWLLLFFSFIFNDVIYLYMILIIFLFSFIFFLVIYYKPLLISKQFVTTILSLCYFYNIEAEIVNIIIYILFLILLFFNICFGYQTFVFIRFLFFIRCFFTFIYFIYQTFPQFQISVLKYSLLQDKQLLDRLHPMEDITLEDFIVLHFKNNVITLDEKNHYFSRYKKMDGIREITIPYQRDIIDNKIIVYEYNENVNLLDQIFNNAEDAITSGLIKRTTERFKK